MDEVCMQFYKKKNIKNEPYFHLLAYLKAQDALKLNRTFNRNMKYLVHFNNYVFFLFILYC